MDKNSWKTLILHPENVMKMKLGTLLPVLFPKIAAENGIVDHGRLM